MNLKQDATFTRRDLLAMIGKSAGGALMYQAMTSLGHASESNYDGAPKLSAAKPGSSVLVLGAGLAGMVAAFELRKAGYKVSILEYSGRAGGRCLTLRGGDTYAELGGAVQRCGFAKGEYFNPGPWRIPFHHRAVFAYCKQFGVQLEPFVHVNHNALVHSTQAFGGKPQRYRHIHADYQGNVAELLGKALAQGSLDKALSQADKDMLLESLRDWGALDSQLRYRQGPESSARRGDEMPAGGGLMPARTFSKPLVPTDLLQSRLWRHIAVGQAYEFHGVFQPVGGMDVIAKAFQKQLGGLIRYDARVTRIEQTERSVTVTYADSSRPDVLSQAKADWCVCTIPLSILSQIEIQVSRGMRRAISAVPYYGSFKIGLQFKRRFWEEDDNIYGGISYTNLPINQISYPSTRYGARGKSVLLGGYSFGPSAYEFTAMSPEQRIQQALNMGSQLHPQYKTKFDNGISVGWHRNPGSQGCFGMWTEETRAKHYRDLCQIDGRIVLAGEHCSYLPAWMEGSLLSGLDAIGRLHQKASA